VNKYFSADFLEGFIKDILATYKVNSEDSSIIAEALICANLMGHDSHGIVHLPEHFSYIPGFESKMVNTQPHIKIEQNTPTITSVDGDRGLGIIGLYKGMELALNSAKDSGMGMAVVKNCYHAGALSYYTRKIADQGMIGIALVNTARLVAPPMGKKRAIGTNPISIGIPYHPNRPLLLDMATSVVASGKIEIARREGEKVPKGLIVDNEGRGTTNPDDYFNNGALLPLGGSPETGGYKGYGLGVMFDVLTGILSGLGHGMSINKEDGQAHTLLILNKDMVLSQDKFTKKMEDMVQDLHSIPTLNEQEILVPGELEWRSYEKRLETGIPLNKEVLFSLKRLAEKRELNNYVKYFEI